MKDGNGIGKFFNQGDIDLMYWNYCVGLLDVAQCINSEATQTFQSLASNKARDILTLYDKRPTFTVTFKVELNTMAMDRNEKQKT